MLFSVSAAQIRLLCAILFEGGAVTTPFALPFSILTTIFSKSFINALHAHHNDQGFCDYMVVSKFDDFNEDYERLFYTGPIDEYFGYKFGELPYRSVNFKFEEYDFPYYQNNKS